MPSWKRFNPASRSEGKSVNVISPNPASSNSTRDLAKEAQINEQANKIVWQEIHGLVGNMTEMLEEMHASDRFKENIMYQVQVLPQMRSLLAYKQFQYLLGTNRETHEDNNPTIKGLPRLLPVFVQQSIDQIRMELKLNAKDGIFVKWREELSKILLDYVGKEEYTERSCYKVSFALERLKLVAVKHSALYNHGHICPLFDNKDTEQLLTNCQVPFDIKFSDEFDVQRHE